MNSLITTAAALAAIAATGAACNSEGGANNDANQSTAAAYPSATTNGAVAAPAASGRAAEGEAEVRAFIEQIYAPYATENGESGDFEAVLEPQLAAAIAAEEGGPGADPFIDAQDWTPFRANIANIQVTGDRAAATATFSNGGESVRIEYQLIRTPAGWRAFDVGSANGGSLRERFLRAGR